MSSPDRLTVIRLSRLGWFGIGLVLLLPWGVVIWTLKPAKATAGLTPNRKAQQEIPASASSSNSKSGRLGSGPWGVLEYSTIMIEPPEAVIPVGDSIAQPPLWTFKGYSDNALQALWQEAGLSPAQQRSLNDPAARRNDASAIVIKPRPEDVLGLSPTARGKIYSALAEFPENPAQRDPFRFRADSINDWFELSELPPETIALTQRLLYQNGSLMFFSDQDIVLPLIGTTAERVRFLKAVSRKSALLLQLRVEPGADAAALARYWGRGRRAKDLEPLLASLTRRPLGGSLDVVHLLPRFARSLLYTFPLPSDNPIDQSLDCHWTSFNFYQEEPDERFSDIAFVKQTLASNYYPVAGEPQLGDIILLLQPGGVVVHSCVFVADDIVFTKNGPGYSVPWLLARLGSVTEFYGRGHELEIRRYRSKDQ